VVPLSGATFDTMHTVTRWSFRKSDLLLNLFLILVMVNLNLRQCSLLQYRSFQSYNGINLRTVHWTSRIRLHRGRFANSLRNILCADFLMYVFGIKYEDSIKSNSAA